MFCSNHLYNYEEMLATSSVDIPKGIKMLRVRFVIKSNKLVYRNAKPTSCFKDAVSNTVSLTLPRKTFAQ